MKDVHQIIEQLTPADASAILQALAASDEKLTGRIAEMALARIQQVDVEEVAAVLYDELEALEVEEVWERAGRKRHGYVETGEAAYQMIEEVLAPFLADLARYQKLGLRAEANGLCEGLLLGFFRFERESTAKCQGLGVGCAAQLCGDGAGCLAGRLAHHRRQPGAQSLCH